ncbi:unnamed protein product [Rhizophagus irregularis]|nr:unnamed protein product [Rhizophagus irregularis]
MSNVATGSTSVSLLTVDEVKKLNSEQLNEYLRRRLKDTKNINKHANTITVDQEVDGSNFLDLTLENLSLIQIPLGPAKDIEKLIKEIKREQPGASEPPKKRRRIDADDVNDEELNKFWRALKDASHKQYLRLSGSTRFLGKEHGFSALKIPKDLFSKWGGIPRYVLERANDETHQSKLIDAIKGCKVKIFDDIGEKCIERSETSHMIAHIDVNPSYKEVILRFASNYVRERVTDKLETSIRARLLEKTKAGTGNSLLGSVFEYIAHRTLWNGGKFDVRPLDKYEDNNNYDSDAIVNLPKQDLPLYFHKTRIDVIEDGVYYQPQESNFPSVDSIIAPNKVFQMTIAKRHSIKMNGLKILYDKFGGESADHLIYYYFVVPEHIYDDYKTQNIANSDGVDAQIIPGWIDDRIFQYVLKIKL